MTYCKGFYNVRLNFKGLKACTETNQSIYLDNLSLTDTLISTNRLKIISVGASLFFFFGIFYLETKSPSLLDSNDKLANPSYKQETR